MTDAPYPGAPARPAWRARLNRLLASPGFQTWAARNPLTRRRVRREGEALFDLVAGFCHSQVLAAFVALDLPDRLMAGERSAADLAFACKVPSGRMTVLLNAAAALGLLARRADRYRLTQRAAALAGVPGLRDMIAHHHLLYADLADPVAFFRGETETQLAAFWPYVFGAGAAERPDTAARYSQLMADSQALVAADTLDAVPLAGVRHLMDVGGGTGAFLAAVAARHPGPGLTLFDLPAVVPAATERFARAGIAHRVTIAAGSFRDDPLPAGADSISLIRVLYDHADETVMALLRSVHAALPPGGRLVISEPMTGSARPQKAGDVYFALYCMAMRTGRARSQTEIAALLRAAGFHDIRTPSPRRAFITSALTAVR